MDKNSVDWHGPCVALATPFDAAGEIDEAAFRENVELCLQNGVTGLLVSGCTGEFWALTKDERKRLYRLCVEAAAGRAPVIGGTGAIRTADVIELTEAAKDAGCSGAMVLPPFLRQAQLRRHRRPLPGGLGCGRDSGPALQHSVGGRERADARADRAARRLRQRGGDQGKLLRPQRLLPHHRPWPATGCGSSGWGCRASWSGPRGPSASTPSIGIRSLAISTSPTSGAIWSARGRFRTSRTRCGTRSWRPIETFTSPSSRP